jgi:lysophospholipase L1-like esterase
MHAEHGNRVWRWAGIVVLAAVLAWGLGSGFQMDAQNAAAAQAAQATGNFHLKAGDHVVFFGDSITDQRLYTTFVETFAVTRFPGVDVKFTHSGWGGDRVTGGGGGSIRTRLMRDVVAYKPTVVTVMLGMNDGRYRAFDQQIFDIFSSGYRNIVQTLKKEVPGVRITAIQPSPYDDVTRAPAFKGGYNATLLRYSDFLAELARTEGIHTADLNKPLVAMLATAKAADAKLAEQIIPDRVHPRGSGHLIMAEQLLKAWGAPSLVSAVEIDAAKKQVGRAENATVTEASFTNGIAWTQLDAALPMPVDMTDEVVALAANSSGFQETLNRQMVRVRGLPAGNHTLYIDGDVAGTYTAKELADGVNLAGVQTPMWAQATKVHQLTLTRANVHNTRWRSIQVPLEEEKPASIDAAIAALDKLSEELRQQQRAAAKPVPHRFEVKPGESGFQPIFNGKDLSGWHISQTNHHGTTQAWKVEDGAITGTQDRPGHGGILLTDKKYKNFEISLEVKPDFSCDGGLFLRSSEKGEAYQVMLDYLDGGAVGGIYGERLEGVRGVSPNWRDYWTANQWNHLRARIEGDVPHIRVWMNGVQIVDWKDTANHLPGGATDGHIAVQVHAGNRWIPGGKHRFRNIQVRELP